MSKLSMIACGVIFLASLQGAYAADKGIYLGASVGQSDVSISSSSNTVSYKDSDTAFKAIVGVRPRDWLAFEANYVDLGKPTNAAVASHPTGLSAFAVGLWGVGPVDLFAKAGAINWNAKVTSNGIKQLSRDGTDVAFGAGVQVSVLLFKVRAEYERFEVDKGANLLSVGVVFTFL